MRWRAVLICPSASFVNGPCHTERSLSRHRMDGYPVIVIHSISTNHILGSWQQNNFILHIPVLGLLDDLDVILRYMYIYI